MTEEFQLGSASSDFNTLTFRPYRVGGYAIGSWLEGDNDSTEVIEDGAEIKSHEADVPMPCLFGLSPKTLEFCVITSQCGSTESWVLAYSRLYIGQDLRDELEAEAIRRNAAADDAEDKVAFDSLHGLTESAAANELK